MKRRFWTPDEDRIVRALFPDVKAVDVAARLNRSVAAVYGRAKFLGIGKSDEFFASPASGRLDGIRGEATRFKPQQKSWNKGKTYSPGGRATATQFKPGQKPASWVPIGTVSVDADGYTKRKIRDDAPRGLSRRNWIYLHVELWTTANGPVPPGHAVVFRDGNKTNLVLENLELVTKRELMARNTIHNYPPELSDLMRLKGVLVRKINKRARCEKQD